MRIMIAQIRVIAGNVRQNFEAVRASVEYARSQQVSLVVFPEMAIPGYFVGDAWEREEFLRDCEEASRAVAALSHDVAIVFGSVGVDWKRRGEDGRVRKFNALFCAQNGVLVENPLVSMPFWPKTLLPNYREFDDSRHFYDLRKLSQERGCHVDELVAPLSLKLAGGETWTFGVGVCEDAWADDYNVSIFDRMIKRHKVDLLLNINCSPYTYGKQKKRERTFGALAQRVGRNLLHVNCVGVQNVGKTVFGFDGSSGVVGPSGRTLFCARFFHEENLVFDASKKDDAVLLVPEDVHAERGAVDSFSRPQEMCLALERIVSSLLLEWKIKRVVVGASGGIDSALSAVLFSRVLGSENVFLVNMPSRHNSDLTKNAAADLAKNLGCPYTVIPIEESCSHTIDQLTRSEFSQTQVRMRPSQFVQENIQARDRGGRILAAVAASLGGVFSCNANKTELTVGYSTLYGDEAGFLAPLADLWKRDVYLLAQYYNDVVFRREVIPVSTLRVKPSAELSPEQDVTKGLGDPIEYDYHDCLFKRWVEAWRRLTPYECLLAYSEGKLEEAIGCETGLVRKLFPTANLFISDLERWWNLYQGMGAVKRMQAPPVVALTQRAFGFDHREAITEPHYGAAYERLKESLLGSSS
jgi:NAD+ synthase (glutamine-hydrolysing)